MSEQRVFPDRAEFGTDGSVRKAHYGDGEQPWDAICRIGYGPQFAASNVIRYLRRTKDRQRSLESARWYWNQLKTRSGKDMNRNHNSWSKAKNKLSMELSTFELELLQNG